MNSSNVDLSDVSLIIATYNEEESLGFVLNELETFKVGEIIIIDKASTDNTRNVAMNYDVKFFTQSKIGWGLSTIPGSPPYG